MTDSARQDILSALKQAPAHEPARHRIQPSAMRETGLGPRESVELLIEKLTPLCDRLERVQDTDTVLSILADILTQEKAERVMVSDDAILKPLDLPEWGRKKGLDIHSPSDYESSEDFREAVFAADAGITGVDVAVAETGTLVIGHDRGQARLISVAPILHIAIVKTEQVVPVYEAAMAKIKATGPLPSQITWITGPSMTADIQATPFRGMHGPKRLMVILAEWS